MIVQQAPSHKFSIFNELITNDHREFYEKIINELIGVSPSATRKVYGCCDQRDRHGTGADNRTDGNESKRSLLN